MKSKVFLFFLCIFKIFSTPPEEGLLMRPAPLNAEMLKNLAFAGMKETFGVEPSEEKTPLEEYGVQFLTDFVNKAPVFQKWLELAPLTPENKVHIENN